MARRKGIPPYGRERTGEEVDLWECLIITAEPATGKTKRIPVYGKTQEEAGRRLLKLWPVFKIKLVELQDS